MKQKWIAVICVFVMCINTCTIYNAWEKETALDTSKAANELHLDDSVQGEGEEFALPDIVDEEEAYANGYIGRAIEEETDLNTFVFKNADGSNTLRTYSHPVKYVDDDGVIKDISLKIESESDGSYITKEHEIITTFEEKITDGITLEYEDIDIKLIPVLETSELFEAELDTSEKVVTYNADSITSYEYQLTYSGFKEDIVVQEYTGQTEYEFCIYTEGLFLEEEYGSYILVDDEGTVKAGIGDIIVFTADERNNTMGYMTHEIVKAGQEYVLTIHLDAEYLADEKTMYPIRIDPTIEINYSNDGNGAIEDVTINNSSTFSGTSGSLNVGRHSGGSLSRVLMRFPKLSLSGISSKQITAATVEIRDLMCQAENLPIECHVYNNSSPAWTESSTTTWSGVGTGYVGTLLSTLTVAYGKGNVSSHRYAFDISAVAKEWADQTQSPQKGLVFKASSTFENQTGTNIKYWLKTFASYNRSSNKPSLSITYNSGITRSLFYSKYDPSKYNDSSSIKSSVGENTDIAQYRMNCYGYAFGFIYKGTILYDKQAYKQQPGEFASTANKGKVVDILVDNNPKAMMNNVVNNMKLDASRWGYSITEYTTSSSVVAQYGTNSRLIAVVTGNNDYHFYMQHNDGTWSHKPGSTEVTNLSIDSKVVLTNSNIKALANQGMYNNGALKFFIITKTSTTDFPHGAMCCLDWPCSHTESTMYRKEMAGDYLQTALTKYLGTSSARIDHCNDHDVYCYTPTTTRTYTITTSCSGAYDLDCKIYDNAGVQISSSTSTGQVSVSIRLVAGQNYFFDVYNYSKVATDYTFKIE